MFARRLRRRPNINPALGQCIEFAGPLAWSIRYFRCKQESFLVFKRPPKYHLQVNIPLRGE